MNYLAHLYLSEPHGDGWIGSLMGDFLKGPVPNDLAPRIREGVVLHRSVDTFTDSHELVLSAKSIFKPPHRRYAGILLDMFFDHCLARDWDRYSDQSLQNFSAEVCNALAENIDSFPERMQRSMRYLLANDLLMSYQELDGISRALRGISGRLSRENPLAESGDELLKHYDQLNEIFSGFFPELIAHSRLFNNPV